MHFRMHKQIHIPENAREPEKVLILAPASAAPFINLHRQLVFPLRKVRCQLKFGWREGIFAVSHILPVQPKGKRALHALEGNEKLPVFHVLRDRKVFYIACRRIEALRDLPGPDFLRTVPGILGVNIGRHIIAFHLDVGRNRNLIPSAAVIACRLKALGRFCIIICIGKFPHPVQRKETVSLFLFEIPVIRMSLQPVLLKNLRIRYNFMIKRLHPVLLFPFRGIILFPPDRIHGASIHAPVRISIIISQNNPSEKRRAAFLCLLRLTEKSGSLFLPV